MGGDAGKNDHFVALLNCMVEHDCMEKYGESGSCLAEDSQALDTKARSQQNYQKLKRFGFLISFTERAGIDKRLQASTSRSS